MVEIFQKYMGTGLMVVWFVSALLYLFFHEKRKPQRILFIYAPTVFLLIFFNPLFYRLFVTAVGSEIYFRICWLLPISVVVGYAAVLLVFSLNGKKRGVIAVAMALMIAFSGKLVYQNPLFSRAENEYHMPQYVVDICDAVKIEGREVMAAFPTEFLLYVRQYSPWVCMPYGREVFTYYDEFYYEMLRDVKDVKKITTLAKQKLCHYVVFAKDTVFDGNMLDYGYELFGEIDGYLVYRDTTMNFSFSNL